MPASPPGALAPCRLRCVQATDSAPLAAPYAAAAGPAQVYSAPQVEAWASFGADTPACRDCLLLPETWVVVGRTDGQALGFCGVGADGEVRSLDVRPELTRRVPAPAPAA